jgi:hypothetical protein
MSGRSRTQAGFTLIVLLVVAILGRLVFVAPPFLGGREGKIAHRPQMSS